MTDSGGLSLIVSDILRTSLSMRDLKSIEKLVDPETGTEDFCELAINEPVLFEKILTLVCGNNTPIILEEIIEELFKYVLPSYDISVYAMRCGAQGQYAKMIYEYNKIINIGNNMHEMKDRDHIAYCYSSQLRLDQMIYSFIMRGIKNNKLNILAINSQEKKNFSSMLSYCGLDLDYMTRSKSLIILLHEELYKNDFGSSFEPVKKKLEESLETVRAKRMSGMNVIGTIAWNLAFEGHYDRCIQIERAWHEIIHSFPVPITLLCPYYSNQVKEDVKAELEQYHNRGLACESRIPTYISMR